MSEKRTLCAEGGRSGESVEAEVSPLEPTLAEVSRLGKGDRRSSCIRIVSASPCTRFCDKTYDAARNPDQEGSAAACGLEDAGIAIRSVSSFTRLSIASTIDGEVSTSPWSATRFFDLIRLKNGLYIPAQDSLDEARQNLPARSSFCCSSGSCISASR